MFGWFVLFSLLFSIPYQIYQILSIFLLFDILLISRIWLLWINCHKIYVHIFWCTYALVSSVYIHSSGISWSLMTLAKIWNCLLSFSCSLEVSPCPTVILICIGSMLNNFAWAYWPVGYSHLWTAYSSFWPIFKLACLKFFKNIFSGYESLSDTYIENFFKSVARLFAFFFFFIMLC